MADAGGILMPSGSGGLMRYNEEYKSRLKMSPVGVIVLVICIIAFVSILKLFFPIL
jgi:preprotein translocase subunit Sec61beta